MIVNVTKNKVFQKVFDFKIITIHSKDWCESESSRINALKIKCD